MNVRGIAAIRAGSGTEHYFMCSRLMEISPEITDPAYWRRRAQQARRMAEQLSDPFARQTLEEIAANCDQLADLTAARRTAKTRN